MLDSPYVSIIDPGQASATGRIGTAISTSAQAGVVALGSDSGGVARAPRIDANGTVAVSVTTPAGTPSQVQAASAAPAVASQYGTLMMGRQDLPTPSSFYPVTLDPVGAINMHPKSKATFRTVATGVTCGTNVILLAMYNGGTMVMRLNDVSIYIPPAGGVGGALLGTNSGLNYYPVRCELRRTTTYTGGTSLTPCPCDSADTLSSGVVMAKSVTSVAGSSQVFHRQDAYATNITGLPFYSRGDGSGKTLVIRPGEGFAIVCIDNGTVNNQNSGSAPITATAEIVATVTQAAA